MIYYLCGPTTGVKDYKCNFEKVEKEYTQKGHTVLNPAWIPKSLSWEKAMSIDMVIVQECEVLLLLPGWENSSGALIEKALAEKIGKRIENYVEEG